VDIAKRTSSPNPTFPSPTLKCHSVDRHLILVFYFLCGNTLLWRCRQPGWCKPCACHSPVQDYPFLWFCLNLQQKNHAVTLTPSLLPGGEENPKEKKQKLMGWDENSLTEQQREKKTTINNSDKSIYNMQRSHHLTLSLLVSRKASPAASSSLKYWAWHHMV